MLPGPFLVLGLITMALPSQPPWGRDRPAACPPRHLMLACGAAWRLRALPSAMREVVSTTATKTVENPVTARRNHAERVQGSIGHLSDPYRTGFKRSSHREPRLADDEQLERVVGRGAVLLVSPDFHRARVDGEVVGADEPARPSSREGVSDRGERSAVEEVRRTAVDDVHAGLL